MIQSLAGMPAGTMGFVATGKLSREDYVEVAIPPLREAVDRGKKIRLLYQIGPEFHGLEAGAYWQELKADLGLGLAHLSAWEKTAVVSDEEWLRRVEALFGWMSPGELRLFGLEELDAAKEWLAA